MLKWTNEPPTKEGWYFIRTFMSKTSVRRVARDANGTLQVFLGPVRQAVRFMSQFGAQWAGPIEEPQEKEEA